MRGGLGRRCCPAVATLGARGVCQAPGGRLPVRGGPRRGCCLGGRACCGDVGIGDDGFDACQRDQYLDWRAWYDSDTDERTECGMVDFGIELFTSNDAESWQCTATPINEEGYPEAGCAGYTFGTGRPEWGIESGDFNVLQTVNLDGMNPSHVLCEVDGAGGNLENTNKTTRSRSTFAAPSTGSCDSNTWRWLPFNVKEFNGEPPHKSFKTLHYEAGSMKKRGELTAEDIADLTYLTYFADFRTKYVRFVTCPAPYNKYPSGVILFGIMLLFDCCCNP